VAGAVVGEGTLHVHISAVRKALGQDRAMLKTSSVAAIACSGAGSLSSGRRPPRRLFIPYPHIRSANGAATDSAE